jgi:hypothetical protein
MLNENKIKGNTKKLQDFKNVLEFFKPKRAKILINVIKNKSLNKQLTDLLDIKMDSIKIKKYHIHLFLNREFRYYFIERSGTFRFSFEDFLSVLAHYANERVVSFILNISSLQIYSNGAITLYEILSKMVNLKILKLWMFHNFIGNYGINYICRGIKNLALLTCLELDLELNNISFEGVRAFSNTIISLVNLRSLMISFSDNRFNVDSVKKLVNSFKSLTNLKSLRLLISFNQLGDECARLIADSISLISNIKNFTLNYNYNGLSDEGCLYLVKKLSQIETIKIYLYDNEISPKTKNELREILNERLYI